MVQYPMYIYETPGRGGEADIGGVSVGAGVVSTRSIESSRVEHQETTQSNDHVPSGVIETDKDGSVFRAENINSENNDKS